MPPVVLSDFAMRRLEHALAAMTKERDALREDGDKLAVLLDAHIPAGLDNYQCEGCQALAAWSKLTNNS